MTQLTKADLLTLNVAYMGEPFVRVMAGGGSNTTLDLAYMGEPFTVAAPGEAPPPPDPPPGGSASGNFFLFF